MLNNLTVAILVAVLAGACEAGVRASVGSDSTGADIVASFEFELPLVFAPNYDADKGNTSRTFLALVAGFDSIDYAWAGVRLAHHSFPISGDTWAWPCGASIEFGAGGSWSKRTQDRNGSAFLFRFSAEFIFCGFVFGWAHWSNAGLAPRNDSIDIFFIGYRVGVFD